MTERGNRSRRTALPQGLVRTLATLALVAGIAVAVAPRVNEVGHTASAASGTVSVTATIRPQSIINPPLTAFSALGDSYIISVSWLNPTSPFTGSLISWGASGVHQGTSVGQDWRHSEVYYAPASTARVAAPLGARYTVTGAALYDGGTTSSVPATASVVLTAPISASSSFPTKAYAASPELVAHFGRVTYQSDLKTLMNVPGGNANLTLGSNPISWSIQLKSTPKVLIYKLKVKPSPLRPGVSTASTTRSTAMLRPRSSLPFYWSLIRPRPNGGPSPYYWSLVGKSGATFSDGYPASSSYGFVWADPGFYRVEVVHELADGFALANTTTVDVARYITLAPTRFPSAASKPSVSARPRRNAMTTLAGTVTPKRTTTVTVRIERKIGGTWKFYRTIRIRSTSSGTWRKKIRIGKTGSFRVRASIGVQFVDTSHEYPPATSAWRTFTVR